jgi:hypothetical protein
MTCRKCVISVKRVRSIRFIRLVIYEKQLECHKLAAEQLLLGQAAQSVREGDTDVHYSTNRSHSSPANSVVDPDPEPDPVRSRTFYLSLTRNRFVMNS